MYYIGGIVQQRVISLALGIRCKHYESRQVPYNITGGP